MLLYMTKSAQLNLKWDSVDNKMLVRMVYWFKLDQEGWPFSTYHTCAASICQHCGLKEAVHVYKLAQWVHNTHVHTRWPLDVEEKRRPQPYMYLKVSHSPSHCVFNRQEWDTHSCWVLCTGRLLAWGMIESFFQRANSTHGHMLIRHSLVHWTGLVIHTHTRNTHIKIQTPLNSCVWTGRCCQISPHLVCVQQ